MKAQPPLPVIVDEHLLKEAVHEGIRAGRKIERRRWFIGLGCYFGIPFTIWLFTLLALVMGNAPTQPNAGFWKVVSDLNRDAAFIWGGPLRFLSTLATLGGLVVVVLGAIAFVGMWMGVLREKMRPSADSASSQNRTKSDS